MVQGSGFRVQVLWFRVQGLGFRVHGLRAVAVTASVRSEFGEVGWYFDQYDIFVVALMWGLGFQG